MINSTDGYIPLSYANGQAILFVRISDITAFGATWVRADGVTYHGVSVPENAYYYHMGTHKIEHRSVTAYIPHAIELASAEKFIFIE